MSESGVSLASLSITAHYNDSSTVADSVIALSASGTTAVTTLSMTAGSWTFTAKGLDYSGYTTCSGSTTVTLASGSQSVSLTLFEQSGTIAVSATLPAAVTSDYCVATAIRADWTAISGGFAASSPSSYLIEIPVGTWTVVVTGSDASGAIYQGATTVTVTNGATASAAVTVSGTAATATSVFVSNPASDLYNTLWNARKSISSLYQPIQYRFASGTYTLSDTWWNVPFACYSGGWSSDGSTRTSNATLLQIPSSSHLSIAASSPCCIEVMTIDGQGGWRTLQINRESYATINKVKIINIASVNPNNSTALGPRAIGINDGSSATITNCAMEGIFDYSAPYYSSDHRLVIKDSTFTGGGGFIGDGDLFLMNVTCAWTLSDGWDTSKKSRSLLNCYCCKIIDVKSSTLTLSAGSNSQSGSTCQLLAIGYSENIKTQVTIKDNTFNFGAVGGENASLYAINFWGLYTGSSISIEGNTFTGTRMPSQATSSTQFIGLASPSSCSDRNDISFALIGNVFDATAKTSGNLSDLGIISTWSDTSPSYATVDIFNNNTFKVAVSGSRTTIILNNGSQIDAYASNVATLVNDPAVTTYLDSSTVSGNTVVAQ